MYTQLHFWPKTAFALLQQVKSYGKKNKNLAIHRKIRRKIVIFTYLNYVSYYFSFPELEYIRTTDFQFFFFLIKFANFSRKLWMNKLCWWHGRCYLETMSLHSYTP